MVPWPHPVLRIQRWMKHSVSVVEQRNPEAVQCCLKTSMGSNLVLGRVTSLGVMVLGWLSPAWLGHWCLQQTWWRLSSCPFPKLRMDVIKEGGRGTRVPLWPNPLLQELKPGVLKDLHYIWEIDSFHKGTTLTPSFAKPDSNTTLRLGQWPRLLVVGLVSGSSLNKE